MTGIIKEIPAGLGVALERELRLGFQLEKATAEQRQKGVRRINRDEVKAVEGLGSLEARIDTSAYHYWGQREGYGCWQDKAFKREFLRDNPQSKVKCGGTKLQVGFGS